MANYAITNSVEGNNVEGTFKVNYSNYNSNYNYKLRISIPRVTLLQRISDYVSGEEFNLTSGTVSYLLNDYMKTTNEVNIGFAVETYSGETLISSGNEKVITCYITDANPIFTDFQVHEGNETVENLTGSTANNIINVNGYSTIIATIFSIRKAVAQKGATMSKYRFVIGDDSVDIPYDEEVDEGGFIPNSSSGVYQVYAIDSRNNSTLVTKQAVAVKDYFNISFNKTTCSAERDNNQVGNNVILTLNGDIWNNNFGVVTNSIKSVTYKFKKTDSSIWINGTTPITPTVSDNSFSFTGQIASDNLDTTWDLNSAYNLQVTIRDELSSSTIEFIINSAIPTICLDKSGVGIMCAYDNSIGGYLQVNGSKIYTQDEVDNLFKRLQFIQDSTTVYVNDASSVLLFSLSDLYLEFGLSNTPDKSKFIAVLNNGDDSISGVHIEGCSWSGNNLYAVLANRITSSLKINYLIFYIP